MAKETLALDLTHAEVPVANTHLPTEEETLT